MLLSIAVFGVALAGETWIGGGVGAAAGVFPGFQDINAQVELDARFEAGRVFGRFDVDFNTYYVAGETSFLLPPEWAMIQVGREGPFARAGVFNPNIGLEDWDIRNNYLPSFSQMFNYASAGRVLGGELGFHFGDGSEVAAFVGSDMDWDDYDISSPTLITGAWVSAEKDLFSTWSGVVLYPMDSYYGLFAAIEVYPHDLVWVTLDGGVGFSESSPYAGGQLVVNVLPEAIVTPVARGEAFYDPDDALGLGLKGTASVGARSYPNDWLTLQVEGKALFGDDTNPGVHPGVYVSAWAHRADPGIYGMPEPE